MSSSSSVASSGQGLSGGDTYVLPPASVLPGQASDTLLYVLIGAGALVLVVLAVVLFKRK